MAYGTNTAFFLFWGFLGLLVQKAMTGPNGTDRIRWRWISMRLGSRLGVARNGDSGVKWTKGDVEEGLNARRGGVCRLVDWSFL